MVPPAREMMPQRILDYIERHFTEAITPHDVADALHYSLCHLTHVTQQLLGASVGDLLLQRRMLAAQRLLAESDLSVTEIARRVGFSDGAYFSRRFSRATGASPSVWRKNFGHPRVRCQPCKTVVPSVTLAQDDAAQTPASAS